VSATTVIAALALLLSAFNSYVLWRDRNPRLKVNGSVGVVPDHSEQTLYTITLSNPSEKAINVTSIGFGIKEGQTLMYGSMAGLGPTPGTLTPLPHRIEPGDSATFWVELERLQNDLREQGYSGNARVTLKARDAVGKAHKKRVSIGLG
jgi:hypothetical protein